MEFGTGIEGMVGLRRNDNDLGVLVSGDQQAVPMPEELNGLFPQAVEGSLEKFDLARFGLL